MTAKHGRDSLKGHDRIERRHLDADHIGQLENGMKRRVVVADAAGGLVQIKRYHRKLTAQTPVIADRILPLRKRE
jgi:hypothetical protein